MVFALLVLFCVTSWFVYRINKTFIRFISSKTSWDLDICEWASSITLVEYGLVYALFMPGSYIVPIFIIGPALFVAIMEHYQKQG